MTRGRWKPIIFDPCILGTDWKTVMAMEHLKPTLLIEWLIDAHAHVFEEVAHDHTCRPNIHRLVVVLLVHDYLGGAVQSRANVS